MDEIKIVDISKSDLHSYKQQLADCVVLTHDGKLYLQYRPENWKTSPDVVNIFGGHVETGETAVQAVIREIHEETGGVINPADLILIGAITEGYTKHTEIVHVFFWHDKGHSITGCYEGELISFDNAEDALDHPKLMDYTRWALKECKARGYLK